MKRPILSALLAAVLVAPASAATNYPQVQLCSPGGGCATVTSGALTTSGSGGGGTGGSVTSAGTSGTSAQAVQGITGGVPLPSVLTGVGSASGTPLFASITNTPSVTFTGPLPTGTNSIGSVTLGAGSAAVGSVTVSNFPGTQPVSGTVGVTSLPSIPTGSNSIGKVIVTSLPSIPTGANTIGNVGINGTVPISGADGTAPVACKITSTSATTCSSPAGFFIGAISNSTAAQTASVACTFASDGLVVPALGAGQIVTFEPDGPGYPTGATTASCTASATPVTTGTPTGGAGIVLLFR